MRSWLAGWSVTASALYHYYPSKPALYGAVLDRTELVVSTELEAAADSAATFVDKLDAALDRAGCVVRDHPTLVEFLSTAAADVARHPELAAFIERPLPPLGAFLSALVDYGVATGEVRAEDRDIVLDVAHALVVGVAALRAVDGRSRLGAIEGFGRLLRGDLIWSVNAGRSVASERR